MRVILCLIIGVFFATSSTAQSAKPTLDPAPDPQHPAAIAELTIPSSGERMPALIYLANGPGPHPTFVLLHGFPGYEKNLDIAQELRRQGFNALFFHYRGAWGADGEYSIAQLDDDALAVLSFLRQPENATKYRVDTSALSLLGHSLGGFTALAVGTQDDALVCVGAMSPVNMGVWKAGLAAKNTYSERLLPYADTLFMLRGFNAAAMSQQLQSASMQEMDTRGFGSALRGKSIFMVVGEQDPTTTPAAMFNPVVAEYEKVDGLELEHHIISGDHSFSWSRLAVTQLVVNWANRDCR